MRNCSLNCITMALGGGRWGAGGGGGGGVLLGG